MDITVVIPTIPPRAELLIRAVQSVNEQTVRPTAVVIMHDIDKQGAAINRQAGLDEVDTEYVAFLDDDDEMYPQHLEVLSTAISNADLIYPWFDVIGGTDPFPRHEGEPWDCSRPHQVPITFLARTKSIRSVGGFTKEWDATLGEDPGTDAEGNRAGEDYRLILRMCAAGMKIVHHPERSWAWHHWTGPEGTGNTMGLPSRW